MQKVKTQTELFKHAIGEKNLTCEKGVAVYKKLVFYRFFEVVSNAYPIFNSIVGKKEIEKAVVKFMQEGSKTPLIWQFPNEFRAFIKKEKLFSELEYMLDLLWFEWIEIELFMRKYKSTKIESFSYKNEYRLNTNVVLKKLKYKVHEREFQTKGNFYVLAYYDIDTKQVLYQDISELLYLFLKQMQKHGLQKALLHVRNITDENLQDVKSFFKATLQELNKLRILRRKK